MGNRRRTFRPRTRAEALSLDVDAFLNSTLVSAQRVREQRKLSAEAPVRMPARFADQCAQALLSSDVEPDWVYDREQVSAGSERLG